MTTQPTSYYVTTPIYYVNAAPHLGTAYCTLLCDVQARFQRQMGKDVKFLTGMDEHGQKVADIAAEHNMEPLAWCDQLEPQFTKLWEHLEISNDDFIRTSSERHYRSVQYLWERMQESGYLYKGSYDGWYCVPEETYFTEMQVKKADALNHTEGQHLCPDCGRPLERIQEESYFFKLSAFQDRLLSYYDEHPDFIQPDFRFNEVKSFVASGLQDLSVSRTSVAWGIPVPFDPKHTTYVWFDALVNYMSAVGYGDMSEAGKETFLHRWPAQTHVVGKDIIRFHCVIWPAMLMALGIDLPKQVFAHGFLLVKNSETGLGEKMSKSRGNAIAPADVIDLLGVEGYRYYFMTDVIHGEDSAISYDRMIQVYNADLANSWGNLVSRSLNMSAKYFDGKTPKCPDVRYFAENPLASIADGLGERWASCMQRFDYTGAKNEVMELIHAANHYIEDGKPWELAKDPAKTPELAALIYSLLEAIRISAHLLMPFMPKTSAEVLRRLSLEDEGRACQVRDTQTCDTQVPDTQVLELTRWGGLHEDVLVEKGDALFPRLA